jgi:hypothetical protein
MVVEGMRRIFVYGFILACLTLGAGVIGAWSLFQGTQNSTAGGQKADLGLSMTVDKTAIFAGENIDFAFILKNKGDKNVSFWMGPPFFDAYLYDLNDVLVARWTEGRAFAAYIEKITLKPGETFSKTIQWNLYSYNHETGGFIPVKPDQYRISGVWLGEPRIETSKIGITVEGTSDTHADVTEFKAVVNGMRSVDVFVCVDISDGLTKKEAELIVGTTFILVMGDYVTHRLDTLTFDDTQIEAHYTWGHSEIDMGHVFDMTADLTALQIAVSHCF